jgi:hypothetical protein
VLETECTARAAGKPFTSPSVEATEVS